MIEYTCKNQRQVGLKARVETDKQTDRRSRLTAITSATNVAGDVITEANAILMDACRLIVEIFAIVSNDNNDEIGSSLVNNKT